MASLSADPREVQGTIPMSFLSFQEATELAYFGAQVLHPQSMRPAMESDSLCVRVKNSYNIDAPGTLIGHARSKRDDWLLTSIVRKKNVTLLGHCLYSNARTIWFPSPSFRCDGESRNICGLHRDIGG